MCVGVGFALYASFMKPRVAALHHTCKSNPSHEGARQLLEKATQPDMAQVHQFVVARCVFWCRCSHHVGLGVAAATVVTPMVGLCPRHGPHLLHAVVKAMHWCSAWLVGKLSKMANAMC